MKFDTAFEDAILAQCLKSKDYLRRATRLAKEHHFTGKERAWIWKQIQDNWVKYREVTTGRLLLAEARREFADEDKRRVVLELADRLVAKSARSPKAALDRLAEFVGQVDAQIAMEKAADALERGDMAAVRTELARASRDNSKEARYTHIRWFEEFEDRQAKRRHEAEHPESYKTIPTGFSRLDKAMSGGARAGELGLVMGTTGRGKSVMLTNLGQSAVNRGFNVVYFGLEMPAHQVAARQDSRWSTFEYYKFKTFEFDPGELKRIEDRHIKAAKKYANKYHIVSFPVRSASIHDIRGALEDLYDDFDFTPDMLLMDSGDHLISPEFAKESFRIQQADVYWKMKELAEEGGYVVWSSVHAGREWAQKLATAEATAEAYDKARIADSVLSLNELKGRAGKDFDDDDEAELDDDTDAEVTSFSGAPAGIRNLDGYLAKYRDGESKFRFVIEADFARMTMRQADDEEHS